MHVLLKRKCGIIYFNDHVAYDLPMTPKIILSSKSHYGISKPKFGAKQHRVEQTLHSITNHFEIICIHANPRLIINKAHHAPAAGRSGTYENTHEQGQCWFWLKKVCSVRILKMPSWYHQTFLVIDKLFKMASHDGRFCIVRFRRLCKFVNFRSISWCNT